MSDNVRSFNDAKEYKEGNTLQSKLLPHFSMILTHLFNDDYTAKDTEVNGQVVEIRRWGTKSSLEINVTDGWFADYEKKAENQEAHKSEYSGGIYALIRYPHPHKQIFQKGCNNQTAIDWLVKLGVLSGAKGSKRKTGEWIYRNADGSILQKVERHEDSKGQKSYPQFGWDAEKQEYVNTLYVWSPHEQSNVKIRQTLYRLPEINEAKNTSNDGPAVKLSSDTIWITEGEKCADTLVALGLVATTAPSGASADWSDGYYAKLLDGFKRAFILPDNDKPGTKLVQRIAHACIGIVPDIRIVQLPVEKEKEDVYDWLANYGGTLDKLCELAEAAEPWDDTRYQDLSWENQLIGGKKGILQIEHNGYTIIYNHQDTRGLFRFDTFANRVRLTKKPVWWSDGVPFEESKFLSDRDKSAIQRWLQREYAGFRLPIESLSNVIYDVAWTDPVNPPQEYVQQVKESYDLDYDILREAAKYCWPSAKPIIVKRPLVNGGYQEVDLVPVIFRKFMIGVVARIMDPGCKNDVVVVLIGPEGIGKSTFWETLAGPEWFTDKLPSVHQYENFIRKLQGCIIGEMAEMESFRNADEAAYKSLFSSRKHRYTDKFEKEAKNYKPQWVPVGSSNDNGAGFLKGTENRRIECVEFGPGKLDIEWTKDNRDRLFGAAARAYDSGENWWLDEDWMLAGQKEVNSHYVETLPNEDLIAEYVSGLEEVLISNVKHLLCIRISHNVYMGSDSFGTDIRPATKADEMFAAKIMKKLGWVKFRPHGMGSRLTVYQRGDKAERIDPDGNKIVSPHQFMIDYINAPQTDNAPKSEGITF